MPMPQGQGFKFFVYIIESPSEVDIYHNTSEGILLSQSLGLQQIPCSLRTAISQNAFEAALKIGLEEQMKIFPNLLPIIHISAHGNQEGVALSNGNLITWRNLREYLLPINRALGHALLLCMSCCKGYSASRMAMEIGNTEHPFFSMVGHFGSPTWSETAVAFSTFYHLLAKDYYIHEAVNAMKVASGNDEWVHTTAEKEQKDYLEYATKKDPKFVLSELTRHIEASPPSDDAKKIR
ncbi:MAG: hypothetical protein HN561_15565 [Candidatus Scalindua sp.]|jgi:hypothetical protein|nr:hypothetical protein [Candidatus Scalindua sp.]MBT7592476.1 hypothetical protein [Candidatus Scalindua sp.]